jgi:5-methylcytosine-specific restriction endonuclease McrA
MDRKCIPHERMIKVYERDEYTCQHCGKVGEFIYRFGIPRVVENPDNVIFRKLYYNGSDVMAFHIDHINPICNGGDNSIDNLQLLCASCNLSKGGKYNGK